MNEKSFKTYTGRQMQDFLGLYYRVQDRKDKLEEEFKKQKESAEDFLKKIYPWSGFYLLSHSLIVGGVFETMGLLERIQEAAQSENKIEDQLKICQDAMEDKYAFETQYRLNSLNDEELGFFLAMFFAMLGNIEGLKMYSQTVSDLVKLAENNDEALFKAVSVDRSVVGNPIISKRIGSAHICGDESFMDKLVKAIKRTKPRREHKLDDVRYMVEVFDEIEGVGSVTHKALAELMINKLRIYPEKEGGDAGEAFKKMIQKRKAIVGK